MIGLNSVLLTSRKFLISSTISANILPLTFSSLSMALPVLFKLSLISKVICAEDNEKSDPESIV